MEMNFFGENAWAKLRDVEIAFQKLIKPIIENQNLTYLQIRIISFISSNKKVTVGNIGAYFDIAGGNISNLCKKLESMGYVTRIRSKEDQRVVYVTLSPKGKKTLKDINISLKDRYEKHIMQYNPELIDELSNSLDNVLRLLQRIISLK